MKDINSSCVKSLQLFNLVDAKSLQLFNLAETYVVDGKCIKSRSSETNISKKEIEKRIKNFENIIVQDKDKIDIYCDIDFLERFRNLINGYFENYRDRNDTIFKAYEAGLIEVHTK